MPRCWAAAVADWVAAASAVAVVAAWAVVGWGGGAVVVAVAAWAVVAVALVAAVRAAVVAVSSAFQVTPRMPSRNRLSRTLPWYRPRSPRRKSLRSRSARPSAPIS